MAISEPWIIQHDWSTLVAEELTRMKEPHESVICVREAGQERLTVQSKDKYVTLT